MKLSFALLAFLWIPSAGLAESKHDEATAPSSRAVGPKSERCRTAIDKLKAAGYVIPACPKSESKTPDSSASILPATYPASAIFLKPYQPGQYLDALDLIRTASAARLPVVINVMGAYGAQLKEVIAKEMPEILLTEDGKVLQLGKGQPRASINLVGDPGTGSTFLHDFGKQMVSRSGEWQFFTTRHDGNPERKDGVTPFGEFLKNECGVSAVMGPPGKKDGDTNKAGYGGNFVPITPSHVLTGGKKVGDKYEVDGNHAAHLKKMQDLGISHTVIDTSFLKVAHADEIIAPVPVKRPAPCNIGYVVADSELGWQQVSTPKPQTKQKSGSFFPFELIRPAYAGLEMIGKRRQPPVDCKHLTLHTLEKATLFESGLINEELLNQMIFFDINFVRSLDMLMSNGRYAEDKKNFPVYQNLINAKPPKYRQLFEKLAETYCVGFSGREKPEYDLVGTADERFANMEELNTKTIPAFMKENLDRLKQAAREKTGCQDPTIIKLPVLFQNIDGKAVTVLPNPVNLVSLGANNDGAQLLVPKSTSSELDEKIKALLSPHGITPHFASSASGHMLDGDHSCSTSVFRVCSPQ